MGSNLLRVKVTKASDPVNWYAKHIGQELDVWAALNRHGEYEVYHNVPGLLIHKDDCEIIERGEGGGTNTWTKTK